MFQLFGAGLVAPASPGSIVSIMALTKQGSYLGVISGVAVAAIVSFLIASFILRTSKDGEEDLSAATDKMEAMKGKKSSVAGALTKEPEVEATEPCTEQKESDDIHKVIFACDAGMGSSAMGSSLLNNKLKKAGIDDVFVTNKAINEIPDDADIVITHKDLTDRAKAKIPTAEHISVENFLNSPAYDVLVERLQGSVAETPETETPEPAEKPTASTEINKVIFACDAGMGSSAMGSSLLKNKFKKAGIDDVFVTNKAINEIPNDADVVITHKDLTDRAKAKIPTAEHISVENFLNSPMYDELVERLKK
jgi:PTS system mannitol-specific IIC component